MENTREKHEQKPMSWCAFQFMRFIMNIKKHFRDIEEEIQLAGMEPGIRILDFGCGLGFNTLPAAKAVGRKGQVFALDLSRQSIKILEKKIRKAGLENVFPILSGGKTGLEDKSMDLVYLHNTLPLVTDKQQVLDEITRVLKPGGRLSYMSRKGSRIYGKDTISDAKLKEILRPCFTLKLEKQGHLIFERLGNAPGAQT